MSTRLVGVDKPCNEARVLIAGLWLVELATDWLKETYRHLRWTAPERGMVAANRITDKQRVLAKIVTVEKLRDCAMARYFQPFFWCRKLLLIEENSKQYKGETVNAYQGWLQQSRFTQIKAYKLEKVANGTTFSKNNLGNYTRIFGKFLPGNYCSILFSFRSFLNSQLNGSHFGNFLGTICRWFNSSGIFGCAVVIRLKYGAADHILSL